MNNIKTIDTRGLDHAEKEKLIFPGIEALQRDETVRVVFDFNPIPFVYLLNVQGTYETGYEKKGPGEWILQVKKVAPRDDQKEQLRALVQELKEGGVSAEAKAKAKTLLQTVDAKTLGIMEEELIKEGISHDA